MKKKISIFALASAFALGATLSLSIGFNAKADDEVTLDSNGYGFADSFDVRLSYDADNNLLTDYNGMRYKVEIPEADYTELAKLNGDATQIKYGVLLAPSDYVAANELNYANVFGEDRVYATSEAQRRDDEENSKQTKLITQAETAEMVKGTGSYYYYHTLTNIPAADLTKNFTAKAYIVKYTVDEDGAVTDAEYHFVDGVKEMNMSYAVQKELEADPENAKAADMNTIYVNGKTQTVKIEYKASYDGANEITGSTEITANLGETVTKDDVLARITDVDLNNYDVTTTFTSQKIYAGKVQNVKLDFNAKKAASTAELVGMYVAGSSSVKIKAETLTYGDYTDVDYTLFADGTIVVDDGTNKTVLGKADLATKKITVNETAMSQVLELGKDVYNAVVGLYDVNGKIVRLNADGTADYDVWGEAVSVKYLLAYNEKLGDYTVTLGDKLVKTLTLGDSVTIADFAKINNATDVKYNDFADYYVCTTEGDNLDKIYRFTTDGTITVGSTEVGAFVLLDNNDLKCVLNDTQYSATYSVQPYLGGSIKTISVKDSDNAVVMTLNCDSVSGNDEFFKAANNLFGYTPEVWNGKSGMAMIGPVRIDGYGTPKTLLTTDPTEVDALKDVKLADGTALWKNAEFGSSGWGMVARTAQKVLLSYYIEPLTKTSGVVHFQTHKVDGQAFVNVFDRPYTITAENKFALDFTADVPHNSGNSNQLQILYTANTVNVDSEGSAATAKNLYDIFGSETGLKYNCTAYRATGAESSIGTFITYNYHTTIAGLESDWYACELRPGITSTAAQDGYSVNDIAYKIDYDYSKNVGKLAVWKGDNNSIRYYTVGIVNGNRFIDMRDPAISRGYPPYDNIKMTNTANAERDYAAIESAIASYNKTFTNIGESTGTVAPTKSIYEKIAGTYKSRKLYHENKSWWWGIGFVLNADGTMSTTSGTGGTGTYTLTELSDTFGEIRIDCTYALTNKDYVGYYALIDGQYVFRITTTAQGNAKYSFMDYTADGCTFATWDVFDAILGENGVYTSGDATLTFAAPVSISDQPYSGGQFTLVDGETTINGTYDIVAMSNTRGKIFFVVNGAMSLGEYELVGGKYVIAVTFNDKAYAFNVDQLKERVVGNYYGVENVEFTDASEVTFASTTEGSITENGITAKFVISGDRVTLTYVKDGLDIVVIK